MHVLWHPRWYLLGLKLEAEMKDALYRWHDCMTKRWVDKHDNVAEYCSFFTEVQVYQVFPDKSYRRIY